MEERFCAQLGSLYMAVNENWKIDENCNGAVSIKMVQIVGKIDISVRRKQIKKSYIRVLPPRMLKRKSSPTSATGLLEGLHCPALLVSQGVVLYLPNCQDKLSTDMQLKKLIIYRADLSFWSLHKARYSSDPICIETAKE